MAELQRFKTQYPYSCPTLLVVALLSLFAMFFIPADARPPSEPLLTHAEMVKAGNFGQDCVFLWSGTPLLKPQKSAVRYIVERCQGNVYSPSPKDVRLIDKVTTITLTVAKATKKNFTFRPTTSGDYRIWFSLTMWWGGAPSCKDEVVLLRVSPTGNVYLLPKAQKRPATDPLEEGRDTEAPLIFVPSPTSAPAATDDLSPSGAAEITPSATSFKPKG